MYSLRKYEEWTHVRSFPRAQNLLFRRRGLGCVGLAALELHGFEGLGLLRLRRHGGTSSKYDPDSIIGMCNHAPNLFTVLLL